MALPMRLSPHASRGGPAADPTRRNDSSRHAAATTTGRDARRGDRVIDEFITRTWTATGASGSGGVPNASTPLGLARTWRRAVRVPLAASLSAGASLLGLVQILRMAFGSLESAGGLSAAALVFGTATLIATLPDSTVLWRVSSLAVAMHAAPIFYATPESVSFLAFLDSFAATIGDERGMQFMFLWGFASFPVLEIVGAWVRRDRLAQEAVRREQRNPLRWRR